MIVAIRHDFLLDLYFRYRRVHTESTKEWLTILDREKVSILICLSFADKLFAELMGENGDCDAATVKVGVQKQLNVCVFLYDVYILM